MILNGNFSPEVLIAAGATFGRQNGDGTMTVLPETFNPALIPAAVLSVAKSAKIVQLQVAYDAAMSAGFTSSALGTPHFYKTDDHRIAMLSGAVASGNQRNFYCQDVATGTWAQTMHTPAQMRQVVDDGAVVAEGYISRLTAKVAQVQAATDQASIDLITW